MFESLGFETLDPRSASVWLGLMLGAAFGALANASRFCFRRAVAGPVEERRPALGVWLLALAVAVIGTQAAVLSGLIDLGDHRLLGANLPVVAILLGGLLFGAGMVLARGCISRLTVLAGTGNLRAVMVLLVLAVVAHATLRGVLAPARVTLGTPQIALGDYASLAALPGGATLWAGLIALAAFAVALRSGAGRWNLVFAALIGLLVPLAWVGTGLVLQDEFDPIPVEALSFTLPWADTLFFGIASTSIAANLGVGLVAGTLLGSLLLSLSRRSFQWQSFSCPVETGRYMSGAVLMGFGGVLAGGCTLGAGLSGIPTLSVAALLAMLAIFAGARLTARLLIPSSAGSAGSSPRPEALPAE